MKKIILFAAVLAIVAGSISCNNQSDKKEQSAETATADVNVYYFHFTRRCATCMAVEENARKAIESLYPNELNTGEYSFASLNLDDGKRELACYQF